MPVIFATTTDLNAIAKVHKASFPDHYLGKFSVKLIEKFYSEFLKQKNIIFLIHTNSNDVDGFVMGGESAVIQKAESAFMKNNKLQILVEIFVRPKTWKESFARIIKIFNKQTN